MPDLLEEKFGLALVLQRKEALRTVDCEDKVSSPTSPGEQLTWVLVKTAHSHLPPNLRDGQTVSREPLVGPLSSHQVAKEFSCRHSAIEDVVKTRRRKKTTVAKQKQLQDPKLFKVCRAQGGNKVKGGGQPGRKSPDQGASIGNQPGKEESREEKRKRKLKRKREKEEVRKKRKAEREDNQKLQQELDGAVEVKRRTKKCGHLQAFVENRRLKGQGELAFEEERGEAKSLLNSNAEVFINFLILQELPR